jgi:hypothetical protein
VQGFGLALILPVAVAAGLTVTDTLPEHTLLPFDAHTRNKIVCATVLLTAIVIEVELLIVGAEVAQAQLLPPLTEYW